MVQQTLVRSAVLMSILLTVVSCASVSMHKPLRSVTDLVPEAMKLVRGMPPNVYVPHIRHSDDYDDSEAIVSESKEQECLKASEILQSIDPRVRFGDFFDDSVPLDRTDWIAYHDRVANDIVVSNHFGMAVEMITNFNEALVATAMLLGHEVGHYIFFAHRLRDNPDKLTPEKSCPRAGHIFPKTVSSFLLVEF